MSEWITNTSIMSVMKGDLEDAKEANLWLFVY